MISLILKINKNKIIKFIIVGVSAAALNILLMVLFVEIFYFKTYFLKNLANIISVEISIFYNFTLSRSWIWNDIRKREGKNLIIQFISFNATSTISIFIRIGMFAVFELIGMFYITNIILGAVVAAGISFVMYDKLVFKE